MNQEWANVLKRCGRPSFAIGLSLHIQKRLARKLYSKLTPCAWSYPATVRSAAKRTEPSYKAGASMGLEGATGGATDVHAFTLKLAHGNLVCAGAPPWDMTFEDPEETVSLHRWNWLLIKLSEDHFQGIREWGLWLMRDWMRRVGDRRTGLSWESYTTGERICNAILFMALAEKQRVALPTIPGDLSHGLAVMAHFLAQRLEYKGSKWTGNHVVNNARALCFAGQALNIDAFTKLSLAILHHDLFRIVNSDGFIREGSSHYHFLITRWVLEMLWVSELAGDRQFRDLVGPLASMLVARCWFFLVFRRQREEWTMPLVGDVSPDFPWSWLIDLPWSDLARHSHAPERLPRRPGPRGWGSLFSDDESAARAFPIPQETLEPKFQAFPDSGWYRLDWGRITLFWHVEPTGVPSFASHGHCDTGACCLYRDGVEILADPGRLNYQEHDPLGTYGVSGSAHNSVLIDGFEPFLYRHASRYPESYRNGKVEVRWGEENERFTISFRHTGFTRLCGDRINFDRTYREEPQALVIEDNIQGQSRHTVETYFQWAPGLTPNHDARSPGVFTIRRELAPPLARFWTVPGQTLAPESEAGWRLVQGQTAPTPLGWYFPGYGERIEASTLVLTCRGRFPYKKRFVLEWMD